MLAITSPPIPRPRILSTIGLPAGNTIAGWLLWHHSGILTAACFPPKIKLAVLVKTAG
jgi:hypothetical protein